MSVYEYQRIMSWIIEQIESGELRPGDMLPSIEQLAEQLGASKTTVKTAESLLRVQGWVEGRQGKGVYVADDPPIGHADSTGSAR